MASRLHFTDRRVIGVVGSVSQIDFRLEGVE
jgi:hypothetical protein